MSVVDGVGSPSASVAVGDGMNVKTTSPITQVGQTGQQIATTWDPTQSALDSESIVTPEGWSTQYTTDGSAWSSIMPSDTSTISGVRTDGSVQSDGYGGGLQVSTSTGTGTVQAGAAAFSGASGGDGYDAFATDTYVLNTWHHHNGSYNLDCHLKASGDSCGPVYSVGGYTTSMGASGAVVDNKVYSVVGEDESGTYGVLCTDISALPFSSCGYTSLSFVDDSGYQYLGTQTLSGTKIYSALLTGRLMCFDIATSSACAGQPYALSGYSATLSNMAAFTISDSGKVFVTANHVWCFDASTGAPCTGTWPVGSLGGTIHSAVPMRDFEGTLDGVCMIRPAGTCYDLTGASVTFPPALATLLDDKPVAGASEVGIASYAFTGTRQYWLIGSWGGPPNYPVCWDWTTQAACAGFVTTTDLGFVRYAIDMDPTNQNCAWTNGDNGQISSFDPFTGAAGCPGPDPTVVVPYTTLVPRMGCAEAGRVRAYRNLSITTPSGVSVTALKVTVKDSDGAAVAGFVDLNPDSSGVIDLSALDPAVTGTHPSIEITSPDTSTIDVAAITASVRYDSDAPQLCLRLVSLQDCPTLAPGQSSTPDVPVSDVAIDGQSVATVSDVDTPTLLNQTVTRADMGSCLGTVSGTAIRSFPGGSAPIAGHTVNLVDGDSTIVATTTTDVDGTYSFANINPADYTVTVAGQTQDATVNATETSTVDFDVPVDLPTAAAVSGGTLQNTPATVAILGTVDSTTTVDLETVQLQDPGDSSWGASAVISGEGTWTVTSGGDLRFVPLASFTGVTTAVNYRFSDGYGTQSEPSTAQVTVLPVLPTASPVHASGVRGGTVSITPDGVGPAVPLVDASLRLIDPDTSAAVSTLVVAHVGTFTANPGTGKIDFTPLGSFVGSATVIYQVTDTLDRVATSTMTIRLDPITLSRPVVTVDVNHTAHRSVTGAPSGSTLTVAGSASHASAVSISGSTVTVVPTHNFSGTITIPVTVVHGTATLTTTVTVRVRPAKVSSGWHDLTARGTTVVHWSATAGAVFYQVRVNGHLKCVTTARTCGVKLLLGPNALVAVTAIGHNAVPAGVAHVPYRTKACVSVGNVYFATSSSTLTGATQSALKKMATIIKTQGFTRACLVGHTDSRGSAAANKALSKLRVNHASSYLKARTHHTTYRQRFTGELAPKAPNNTAAGRAANRRVEVGVF